MPPKEKGKDQGKGKGKNVIKKPECLPPAEVIPPDEQSPEFYLSQIADLEQRVKIYHQRHLDLLDENDHLQKRYEHILEVRKQLIDQAKNKLKEKNDQIADLEREIQELQDLIDKLNQEFEELMANMKTTYDETEAQITAENAELQEKISITETFKVQRDDLLAKIAELEENLVIQSEVHAQEKIDMEKRHLQSRNRLKKDIGFKVTEVAAEFRKAADASLKPTIKRVLLENYQINMRITEMEAEMTRVLKEKVSLRKLEVQQKALIDDLESVAGDQTKKNVAMKMILKKLYEKRNNVKDSIKKYKPVQLHNVESVSDILRLMNAQNTSIQNELSMALRRKDEMEMNCFDSRYELACERCLCIQLTEVLRGLSWALRDLSAPQVKLDCAGADNDVVAVSRGDVVEQFLDIFSRALEFGVGPSIGDISSIFEPNLKKELSKQPLAPTMKFVNGDLGLVPGPHDHVPTNREHLQAIRYLKHQQTCMLIRQMDSAANNRSILAK